MADVELLLRNYGQEVNDRCPPITVVELEHHVELTTTDDQGVDGVVVDYLQQRPDEPDTPSPRRGWSGVAGAVAATILLLIGIVVVADGDGGDVVTDPASTSSVTVLPAGESDTDPPVSVTDSLGYRWSRVVYDQEPLGGARMNGVAAGGPGLVAVGDTGHAPAVWTSVDGITWSKVPPHAVFGERGAGMSSVTAGGPGLVAVGGTGSAAAVWTSVDGITWARVPHDEAVFGGPDEQAMSDVVVGGPGLVAVGWDGDYSAGALVAAVWTSVDGLSWSRVPHDEAVFGGAINQTMSSVTVAGPGLVAVGRDGDLPGWEHPPADTAAAAVWTSVDGLNWSRVPHDEAIFGGADLTSMTSVTAGGPGVVAFGWGPRPKDAPDEVAIVWTSPDGLTWSRAPQNEALPSGLSVTATSRGLVAVGEADTAAIWTSPDGFSWSRAPHDEAVFGEPGTYNYRNNMHSVIAVGQGVVAVGEGPSGTGPAVWVGVAEN